MLQLIYVKAAIDANVFIHGRGNFDFTPVTVPEVVKEIKSRKGERILRSTELRTEKPSDHILGETLDKSREINSPTSRTDEKLVALALENGYEVVSDDRAVQNLALHLDVDARGWLDDVTETRVEWEKRCDNCDRIFEEECVCGSSSYRLKQVRCSSG